MVTFPTQPWDGTLWNKDGDSCETRVDLVQLAKLAVKVRARVLELHQQGEVFLALKPEEARRRYFFKHPVAL